MLTILSARHDPTAYLAVPGHAIAPELLARQAPDELLVAEGGGPVRARCGLWWSRTPPWPDGRLGLVGHYYAADAEAGAALLAAACDRLAEHGCDRAVGPIDGNTWQRYRLVVERGDEPPFFLEPDHPDDWPGHFAAAGFTSLARYCSSVAEGLDRRDPRRDEAERRLAERGVRLRPFEAARFDAELGALYELSLACFAGNFLFTPLPRADFLAQYLPLRPYLRPELVFLAEGEAGPVGFIFVLLDFLQQARGRPIDTAIVKTMAVLPAWQGVGLGGLLMDRAHEAAHEAGCRRMIHALYHEAAASGRISRHTATVFRRYALFSRPLERRP